MTDVLTEITNAAVTIFRSKDATVFPQDNTFSYFISLDTVLRGAHSASMLPPESKKILSELIKLLFSDPNLKELSPIEGELDPMILYPGGGIRTSSAALISSLFSTAFLHMYYLRLPNEERALLGTFLNP